MTLQSNRFGIEPELTAKIFKRGYRVYEVPITYDGRGLRRRQEDHLARRRRRALGAAEVPVHRVNALLRLLRYAAPIACGSSGRLRRCSCTARRRRCLPAQIKAIFDRSCPAGAGRGRSPWPSSCAYLLKGLGGYLSSYLMTDVGQRVVRDLRTGCSAHILEPVGGFLRAPLDRAADVAHHQRRRPGAARRVGDDGRPAAESLRSSATRALLFWYDARLALVCMTGAPLSSIRWPTWASGAPQDDAPQPGSARGPLSRQRPRRLPVTASSRRSARGSRGGRFAAALVAVVART